MRTSLEKNLQPIPRTLEQATREAEYAMWLYGFKSDAKLTWEFICNAFLGALWVTVVGGAVVGMFYMVFK